MKKPLLSALALAVSSFAFAQTTQTFNYTGSVQTFTVPNSVYSITIEAYGAQGDSIVPGGSPGRGGYATGILTVAPGNVLNIYVGGRTGYNGGGAGGTNGNPAFGYGGSGGGASDVRLNGTALTDRVIVAGGGGGGASNGVWTSCQVAGPAGNGGAGGNLTGGSGTFGVGTPCNCGGGGGDGGQGGTQAVGGLHGTYAGSTACLRSNWTAGADGALGQGGAGSTVYYNGTGGGGGGGGGYYGGGSGGNGSDTTPGGGGGGGSSYVGALTSTSTTAGTHAGDGMIKITYTIGLGVVEEMLNNSIFIFPNPGSGMFTIAVNASVNDLNISVTDEIGSVVYSSKESNVQTGFSKKMDLQNLAAGTYFVKLSNNQAQVIKKIVIAK